MLRPILCCLLVASMCLAGCTSTEELNEKAELPEGSECWVVIAETSYWIVNETTMETKHPTEATLEYDEECRLTYRVDVEDGGIWEQFKTYNTNGSISKIISSWTSGDEIYQYQEENYFYTDGLLNYSYLVDTDGPGGELRWDRTTTYTYDNQGREVKKNIVDYHDQNITKTYDEQGNMVEKVVEMNTDNVIVYTYTYNNSLLMTETRTVDGEVDISVYTYDDNGKLVQISNDVQQFVYNYTNDDLGNRISEEYHEYDRPSISGGHTMRTFTWGDPTSILDS
jgi:hypothetical protein